MAKQNLSTQKVIKKSRRNRLYLKILFAFSILGFVAQVGKIERGISHDGFLGFEFILNIVLLGLHYLLVTLCAPSYAVMIIGVRLLGTAVTMLTTPLTENTLFLLHTTNVIVSIFYFFAFLSCKRIHRYLSMISVPPKPPSSKSLDSP